MKKIILGIVVSILAIGTVVYAGNNTTKKATCCHKEAACCYPGSPCCNK